MKPNKIVPITNCSMCDKQFYKFESKQISCSKCNKIQSEDDEIISSTNQKNNFTNITAPIIDKKNNTILISIKSAINNKNFTDVINHKPCSACGEYYNKNELIDSVCPNCKPLQCKICKNIYKLYELNNSICFECEYDNKHKNNCIII